MKGDAERDHGTRARYVFGARGSDRTNGCRCQPCTDANRTYARDHARRRSRPDETAVPAYVDATPARHHLRALSAAGVGRRQVHAASGVAVSTIDRIRSGTLRRARPATVDALLAVQEAAAAATARVPAGPTWKRIDQLLASGWTKAAISAAIGQGGRALQLGRTTVHARHAKAIEELAQQEAAAARRRLTDEERLERERELLTDRDAFYDELASILEDRQADWRHRAACADPTVPTSLFFSARGQSTTAARSICDQCPVRQACADYALDHERSLPGIWGGLSPNERAANAPDEHRATS